jgi:Na+/melibiose symporter-like transporter
VAISTFLAGRLHECVASSIRAGVSSGVGTLTWIVFLPFALGFGAVSDRAGVHAAGWMIVAVAAVTSVALVRVASARRARPVPCATVEPSASGPLAAPSPAAA